MTIKKIIKYLLCLLPWFLSAILFPSNMDYYESLNKPFFAPSGIVFPIVWGILFLLIAYSIYLTVDKSNSKYRIYVYLNYLFNQLYSFFFFKLESPLLGLIDTIIVLITGILLYRETKTINKKASKFLIPYLAWSIFATILSLSIYLMN